MDSKKCSRCEEIKALVFFDKDSSRKDGFAYICKDCVKRKYQSRKDKPKITIDKKTCISCKKKKNKESFYKSKASIDGYLSICKCCSKKNDKDKYQKNKKEICIQRAVFYKKNKDSILAQKKDYRVKNIDKIKKRKRLYYLDNIKDIKEKDRIYFQENKTKIVAKHKLYERDRLKNDLGYRLSKNLRGRVSKAVKNNSGIKILKTEKLLGCSVFKVREHLEKQFVDNMTWENYGKWHIDHIIPCASFDLTKESEQLKCFHYTNLQPLWAIDNLKKGDKILL